MKNSKASKSFPQNGAFLNIDSRTAFRTKLPPKSSRFRGLLICSKNVRFLNARARADHINYKANSHMSFLSTIARHRTVKAVECLAEFIFCSFLSVGEVR